MLLDLFADAKKSGILKEDADEEALSRLVMSCVEGAILISKASKDTESLVKTVDALKSVIARCRA